MIWFTLALAATPEDLSAAQPSEAAPRVEAPATLPALPLPWPITMTVRVHDEAGKPVPDAAMQIVGEDLSHGLDAEGTWTGGGIWVTDASVPRYFDKGEAVHVSVTAPGYAPVKAVMVLTKNPKKNVFTLVMKPDGQPQR